MVLDDETQQPTTDTPVGLLFGGEWSSVLQRDRERAAKRGDDSGEEGHGNGSDARESKTGGTPSREALLVPRGIVLWWVTGALEIQKSKGQILRADAGSPSPSVSTRRVSLHQHDARRPVRLRTKTDRSFRKAFPDRNSRNGCAARHEDSEGWGLVINAVAFGQPVFAS